MGLEPRIAHRSSEFETVRALVARGLGYSILMQRPPSEVSYEGLPLATRPVADDVERSDVCIAHPRGQRMTRRVQALIEYCRETFPEHGHGIVARSN